MLFWCKRESFFANTYKVTSPWKFCPSEVLYYKVAVSIDLKYRAEVSHSKTMLQMMLLTYWWGIVPLNSYKVFKY